MQLDLTDKKIQSKILIYIKSFYSKHRQIFKIDSMDYEDFKQEIYLRLLKINVDPALYSEGFLVLCLYSKMKSILTFASKKKPEQKTLIDVIENFWHDTINDLDYMKNFLMDSLSFRQAFIVINRVFEVNTFEKIASILDCSKQNVHYHYKKALLKLKDELK